MKLCQNSNWKEEKIKTLFIERVEKNVNSNEDYLSIVKDVGVVPYSEKGNVGNKTSDNPENYKMVYQDDLVINPMNIKIGSVGISKYFGCLSSVYIVLKPNKKLIPNYYGYLFELKPFQKSLKKISNGIMEIRESINKIEFYSLKLPYPPLEQQQQIVSFLDSKIELIDSLIQKSGRKIRLLKEKRTSLINELVTKGLNPDVEMKDSGVEWIGESPSHWEIKKLKYISKIIYGVSPPDTTYNDKGIGTLLINGPVEYSKTDFGYTRGIKWTTEPSKFTTKGSLLFCLRGSTTGRMNITHTDVSIGRGVCSINSKENQWFLIYSMFSVRRWIQDQISGSTFPSVKSDDVNNYIICSPPLKEQQQIVEHLDKQTRIIDKTISNEEKRIDLLKEYRQSLISEVVTGQRKVTY